MDIVRIDSNRVWLSSTEDRDALYAKFLICDFSTNLNNVRLSRTRIDEWISTLEDQPLVGKIVMRADGTQDFTGHNAHLVKRTDEDGTEYEDVEFDTSAFGTFKDVAIEEIDGRECIVATAKVWRRFHDASTIIEKRCAAGDLHTSWEIGVDEASVEIEDGRPVKVIESGRFIGHCLLGKNVLPAYPCSGLLDVAEADEDQALLNAIVRETMISEENVDMPNEETIVTEPIAEPIPVVDEPVVEPAVEEPIAEPIVEPAVEESAEEPAAEEPVVEPVVEQSALTMWDLHDAISRAAREAYNTWLYIAFWFPEEHICWAKTDECNGELDYVMFSYEVTEDEKIVIGEPMPVTLTVSVSALNNYIVDLNETIASLNADNENLRSEVATLDVYRKAHEEAEHAKAVAELRQYILDSGRFTEDEVEGEEISSVLNELDHAKVNQMISERVVAEMRKAKPVVASVSKKNTEIVLPPSEKVDQAALIRNLLRR